MKEKKNITSIFKIWTLILLCTFNCKMTLKSFYLLLFGEYSGFLFSFENCTSLRWKVIQDLDNNLTGFKVSMSDTQKKIVSNFT